MRIERTTSFDVPVTTVYALMTTPQFQDAKAAALGALRASATADPAGDGVRVTSRRVLPAVDVPEFIKSMVEPTITVTETEVWDAAAPEGHRVATFTVEVRGAPIRVDGHVSIEPTSLGCRLTFDGNLTTSVPLFKSAIERAAGQQVIATITQEFELLHAQLSPHSPTGRETLR